MDEEIKRRYRTFPQVIIGLVLLSAMAWIANAQEQRPQQTSPSSAIHARHILGFEDQKGNADGELLIAGNNLQFQRHGGSAAHVSIASIQKVSVGEEDRQVGGVPMMVGKAAVPYGGGRIVSLFSHKKFDTLSIEYRDAIGGLHGAIFLVGRGKARAMEQELNFLRPQTSTQTDAVVARWAGEQAGNAAHSRSVQVEVVDPCDTALGPAFSDAIYENVLKELKKTKQFENVFRSGDRDAAASPDVLVLTTVVRKYAPGSETKRAVTTIAGATKLNVHIVVQKRDGGVVMERNIEGDVRFFGDNMRAAKTLGRKVAKAMNQAELPAPFTAPRQQASR